MGKKGSYTTKQFIDAIPGSAGIISTIAKRIGCDWHTAKKYCTEYATVKQAYQDECEKVLDLAETKLIEAMNTGDGPMIRYYLSTKGKGRGYVNKVETEGRNLNIDLSQLTIDQLERIANGEDPIRVLASSGTS